MSLNVGARHLSKTFGAFSAVSDVSVEFKPGEIHAVLGENGAGKTTLMKLLFGLLAPSAGEILIDGAPVEWRSPRDAIARGLGMVQQHFSLVEPLSAIDNVMLGAEPTGLFGALRRQEAIDRLESLLPSRSLAVDWRAPAGSFSVGEKQRLEILKLIYRQADALFFDEPTAVLAPREIDEFFDLLRALKAAGRTVVLITHKINEVIQICDSYSVMRGGRLEASGAVAQTSADSIVETMIGRARREPPSLRAPAREEVALDCRDVRERGVARDRVRGANLCVRAGEIVGIAGIEGSGQSSLVDAIMGLREFDGAIEISGSEVKSGAVGRARALGCGLVPEDRLSQAVWLEQSARLNMIIGLEERFTGAFGALQDAEIDRATRLWAEDFDVRSSRGLDVAIASMSGGNQQKAVFARETAGRKPALLICHQPTRGVDLGAIEMIHKRLLDLRNQGLAALVLSSEIEELMALSDRIYVFFAGRPTAEFARANFDRLLIGAAMTGNASELKGALQ